MADSVQIYLRTDCNNSKSANLMDPSYIQQLIKMFIFFSQMYPSFKEQSSSFHSALK